MGESQNKVSLFEENEAVSNTNQLKKVTSDGKLSPLPFGRGCMKGKMWMSDDFDAPMDDFQGNETVTNCYQLKMVAPDGKMRLTDIAPHRV